MLNFNPRLTIFKLIDQRDGYTVGERVTRTVTFDYSHTNGRTEQLIFTDENGVMLLWNTSPSNKTCRQIHGTMTLTFLVRQIRSGEQKKEPKIRISHVAIEPQPKGVVRDGGR